MSDGDLSDLEPVGGVVGKIIEIIDPTPDMSSGTTVIGPAPDQPQQ